jgi:hypothetical protein
MSAALIDEGIIVAVNMKLEKGCERPEAGVRLSSRAPQLTFGSITESRPAVPGCPALRGRNLTRSDTDAQSS